MKRLGNLETLQWPVSRLIDYFEQGQIAIPEIQRDFVWDSEQVKALFDSIYHNYPCGSLILWEPKLSDGKLLREIIKPERLAYYNRKLPTYFLVDGQQRITALSSVLLPPGFLKRVEPDIEEDLASLYANLKHFPDEIEAAEDGDYKFPRVLMNDVFSGSLRDQPKYKHELTAKQRSEIDHYIQRVRDYIFPVQIVKDTDYPTVGKIFSRVNSQGTPLDAAEIHLATIIPHWPGIAAEFRKYRRVLKSDGYDLDLTFLMRSITVIARDRPQIKKLADDVSQERITKAQLNRHWSETKRAINTVVRILKRDLLLDKTKLFVSKNAIVPLVYYAAKIKRGRQNPKRMMKYFLVSQLGGHYSRGTENVLRSDLKLLDIRDVGPEKGLPELLDFAVQEARQEYRGLSISYRKITGPASKNVMLLLMYIAMRKRAATDFGLKGAHALDEISGSELQYHHIFPFNFMMKDGKAGLYKDRRMLDNDEFRQEVNDIANITFLSAAVNVRIGDAPPWEYLETDTTPDMRKAHFIPEDRNLWKPEKFDKFLEQRRRMLAEAMNSILRALG